MDRFDVVAFGAHPDDLEAVMGGTTAVLVRRGLSILFVDLCDGEPARHAGHGVRHVQAERAAGILGVTRETLTMTDRFIRDSIEARLGVARLIRQHRPRFVFTTLGSGVHPDHAAATDIVVGGDTLADSEPHEIERLFFGHCRMEPPWDRFDFAVDVSGVYPQKMAALSAYESVFSGDQAMLLAKYTAEDRFVGSLVGVEYAEGFRARSPLLVASPEAFAPARFG